jgi:hypothetical protein
VPPNKEPITTAAVSGLLLLFSDSDGCFGVGDVVSDVVGIAELDDVFGVGDGKLVDAALIGEGSNSFVHTYSSFLLMSSNKISLSTV